MLVPWGGKPGGFASMAEMTAMIVAVFPVPGGPWQNNQLSELACNT